MADVSSPEELLIVVSRVVLMDVGLLCWVTEFLPFDVLHRRHVDVKEADDNHRQVPHGGLHAAPRAALPGQEIFT